MEHNYPAPPEGFVVIPGLPFYAINKSGEVLTYYHAWNPINTRRRTPTSCQTVQLQSDDRTVRDYKEYRVCALVLLVFSGEPLRKSAKIIHRDGDPTNNDPGNLVYAAAWEAGKGTQAISLTPPRSFMQERKAVQDQYTPTQLVEAYTGLMGHGLSVNMVSRLTKVDEDHLRILFLIDGDSAW